MNIKTCMASVLGLALGALTYHQSQAATESVDVSATIVTAVTLAESAPLDFGSLASGASGGTVVIDPAGGYSMTGDVTEMGGTIQPAMIAVSAEPNVQLVTSTDSVVTLQAGANTMTVNNFHIQTAGSGSTKTILLSTGSENIAIGATLNVGPSQPPGHYTGTFTYTADYQ